ncbi:MAG: hypothetical protein LBU66_06725, partial [Treponema sp.]|nr:hypothetical protein [Treponema sp.]
MLRKSLIIGVLLAVSCSMLWAAGRKDNISRTAEDPSAFTDVMDTSEHKPGKYNFYLEATDKAGNVTRSGPDNIFIDPASDLPRVTIINPMLYMRVQGNLNMVGIAMDDDGVAEVHLTVHRGRDTRGEELVRAVADGTDYWSYFLDTTDPEIWTDGPYTITAWAVDINGLSGIADTYANGTRVNPKQHRKHSLYFYLDRRKPDIVVTSHDTGALVAGNIRLRGTVYDGNGIRDLRYSIDGGDRYINVPVKEDKKTGIYNWDINLSTKVFEDGPAVLWFKSRDMMGSEGVGAHLLFVNNTGPKVEIVYPPPREEVNGIFTVAGYASHPVGLKKVTWKAGKKSGEIELLAGNHWWSTPIDIRGEKINSIDVEIRAEDVSGNVTVARQRYRVNQNADLPVVTVSEPVTGAVLTDRFNVVVKGTAVDNDGVSALLYSVNGGAAVEIPCSGYFQFMIPELNEGANTLEVWARDITGVVGNKVLVRNINVPGDPVESKITRVITGSGNTASNVQFNTGMQVTLQPKVRVNMDVEIKAMALTSASIKFGETPEIPIRGQPARDGFLRTTIQVPERLPSGLTPIKITT